MERRDSRDRDRDDRRGGAANGPDALRNKRSRHLEGVQDIDFRDYDLLRRFITEQGRILPARITGTTPKQQRRIRQSIRRARVMGLLK